MPCSAQRADGAQAPVRRGGTRLQLAREFGIQRGDRDVHGHQLAGRHRRQQVQVPLDAAGLGDHRERMPAFLQQFDHGAREPQLALHRLVDIGRRPERQPAGLVAFLRQLRAQHRAMLRLAMILVSKSRPGDRFR
jgi:hypothetical protein